MGSGARSERIAPRFAPIEISSRTTACRATAFSAPMDRGRCRMPVVAAFVFTCRRVGPFPGAHRDDAGQQQADYGHGPFPLPASGRQIWPAIPRIRPVRPAGCASGPGLKLGSVASLRLQGHPQADDPYQHPAPPTGELPVRRPGRANQSALEARRAAAAAWNDTRHRSGSAVYWTPLKEVTAVKDAS